MYFIDPNECNECGLCVLACPKDAVRSSPHPFSPYVWGMIAVYSECVSKGVKPVAQINVTEAQAGYLSRHLAKRGLRSYYRRSGDKLNAFIYKDPSLLTKIKGLDFRSKNPEDHAKYGRLFGYSDETIQAYVTRVWKPKAPQRKANSS